MRSGSREVGGGEQAGRAGVAGPRGVALAPDVVATSRAIRPARRAAPRRRPTSPEPNGAQVSSSCRVHCTLHRPAGHGPRQQHGVERRVVGGVVAVAAGVLDVLDADGAPRPGRGRRRSRRAAGGCPGCGSTPSSACRRRSSARRAARRDGGVREERPAVASRRRRAAGAGAPASVGRATSIVSCGPARRKAAGRPRRAACRVSSQVGRAAQRAAARGHLGLVRADHAEERAVADHGDARRRPAVGVERRAAAPGDGGRSTRPNSWPGSRRSAMKRGRPATLSGRSSRGRSVPTSPAARRSAGTAGRRARRGRGRRPARRTRWPRSPARSRSVATVTSSDRRPSAGGRGHEQRPHLARTRPQRRAGVRAPTGCPAVRPSSGPCAVCAGSIRTRSSGDAERVGGDLRERGEDALAELDLADPHVDRAVGADPRPSGPAAGWRRGRRQAMDAGLFGASSVAAGPAASDGARRCGAGRRSGTGCGRAPRRPGRSSGVRVRVEQGGRAHHDAGDAEAALGGLLVEERLLHAGAARRSAPAPRR